jgi:hypothetical protein
MKYLLPLFILICSTTYGQKLVTDKTDEFTGARVKETSIENLAKPFKMSGFAYTFAFRKIDDKIYFNLRLMSMSNSVFSIKDGEILSLKLDNDSIINLSNGEYAISKRGGAGSGLSSGSSQGVSLLFPLSINSIDLLKTRPIVKVRIYTTDGYSEQEIKSSASKRVIDALTLLL